MGWIKNYFNEPAEDWVFQPLEQHQVPEELKVNDIITPNEAYVTVTLRSMRIVNVRKLTTKFYGVVHSYIELAHLSGQNASFQTVTSPIKLRQIDSKNTDNVVQVNLPLLGPIPYRGGPFSLELGLFSVKDADLAAPFIDILQSMASQAGVSVVSAAIPFTEPLRKGIDALFGMSDGSILQIGVSTNLDPLKTGWYIVMRAPRGSIDVSKLRVTPVDFRLVDADTNAQIKDFPYMIFTVAKDEKRPDFYALPELSKHYKGLKEAVRNGDYTTAADLIITFKRSALTSDDLIPTDAKRIADLVEQEVKRVMSATVVARLPEHAELPSLESYQLYEN